jgi:HEAT repeat protein
MLPAYSQSGVYIHVSVRLRLSAFSLKATCVLFATALLLVGNGKAQEKADRIDDLIKQLHSSDFLTRDSAVVALEQIGPGAVPALVVALKDQNAGVRSDAAKLLWRMGPKAKEAVPALIS